MSASRDRGARFGLLFSDIKPAYYSRLGFQLTSPMTFVCEDLAALARSGARSVLEPLCGRDSLDLLLESCQSRHRKLPLSLWRDRAEWQYWLDCNEDLDFLGIRDPSGALLGYLWIFQSAERIVPVELQLSRPDAESEARALRALAAYAAEHSLPMMSQWAAPPEPLSGFYRAQQRDKSLPMIWSDPELGIPRAISAAVPVYSSFYF